MRITEANFSADSFEASILPLQDEADQIYFFDYTMPHEVGHALGLDDEYLEPATDPATGSAITDTPVLPTFYNEDDRVLPYTVEEHISLMGSNAAPRMRHFWHFTDWLNHHAEVQKLLSRRQYGIEYSLKSNKTLRYFLEERYRKYNNAFKEDMRFRNGLGHMDLLLYKTGEDEMQQGNIRPGVFGIDSILVVILKLSYQFVQNAENAVIASWTDRIREVRDLLEAIELHNGRNPTSILFTLESPRGDFRKCLVYFIPMFDLTGTSASEGHFEIEVRRHSAVATNNVTDLDQATEDSIAMGMSSSSSGSMQVRITDESEPISLFRYMLGLPAVVEKGGVVEPISSVRAGDLEFLKKWMEKKCEQTYTVVETF